MPRISHELKVIMAKRMMTNKEKKEHVPMFQCQAWLKRKWNIKNRVKRKLKKKEVKTIFPSEFSQEVSYNWYERLWLYLKKILKI